MIDEKFLEEGILEKCNLCNKERGMMPLLFWRIEEDLSHERISEILSLYLLREDARNLLE
jgi:hypothetical protein